MNITDNFKNEEFKTGDKVFHKGLKLVGEFLKYDNDTDCYVNFYNEESNQERCVSVCELVNLTKISIEAQEILDLAYSDKLRELKSSDDVEINHITADYYLCELLEALGYKNLVKQFNSLEKRYA